MKERCKIRSYMPYKSYLFFCLLGGLENASIIPMMRYKNALRLVAGNVCCAKGINSKNKTIELSK